jgi:hypothetical protein
LSETVLQSEGPWQEVYPERANRKDPAPLKVREVVVAGRRYIVCLNEEERRKDAQDRAAIVAHLRQQLKHGDKSLVGNKGYRRYLKREGAGHFMVDEESLGSEARFDGLWVLRTNRDDPAPTVALHYKGLEQVEALIRTTKSILETRPSCSSSQLSPPITISPSAMSAKPSPPASSIIMQVPSSITVTRNTVTRIRPAIIHCGDEVAAILKRRPDKRPLFPYLRTIDAKYRATEFKQRCQGLKIEGVSLHSYRYAWAERAKVADYGDPALPISPYSCRFASGENRPSPAV